MRLIAESQYFDFFLTLTPVFPVASLLLPEFQLFSPLLLDPQWFWQQMTENLAIFDDKSSTWQFFFLEHSGRKAQLIYYRPD